MKMTFIALAGLMAIGSANAFVYAPDSTPEEDIYDGDTHLQWIKTSTLQEGLDAGYRQATAGEAYSLMLKTGIGGTYNSPYQGLPYFGEPRSVFFEMGTNYAPPITNLVNGTEAVSIGYVDAGPNSEPTLAGMASAYSKYGSPKYGMQTVRGGAILVGTQADFEANKDNHAPSYMFVWPTALQPNLYNASGQLDVGYFMVKTNLSLSPIPETSTSVMMVVGLLGVAGIKRRSRR